MATIEETTQKRWEGTVRSKIKGVSKDRVWPFLADFFNWQTIFEGIESSIGLEGISGEVGCVRKMTSKSDSNIGWDTKDNRWGIARLVDIDHSRKWMSYEILDNTFGFDNYKATITILPLEGIIEGSEFVWSFSFDPVKDGRSMDTIIHAYKATLEPGIARLEQLCGLPSEIIIQ